MPMLRGMKPIESVIDAAGGASALAQRLGVKPPTVSQWRSGARPVPPRLALRIQQEFPDLQDAKAGALRPDIFGEPPNTEAA